MLQVSNIIDGVSLLPQRIHRDNRGELVAYEEFENVPFTPKRTFYIKVEVSGYERGGHANSCDELISVLSGSLKIFVDNGTQSAEITLSGSEEALWIQSGILINLSDFAAGTILLVCASERYEDTRHFNTAQFTQAAALCSV